MSSTLDASVLLYASDETSPFSCPRDRFPRTARERARSHLPVLAHRDGVSAHRDPFVDLRDPLPTSVAVANIEGLITLPHVQTVGEQERFWHTWSEIAAEPGVAGNLVSDVHVVALMRENGVRTIWTNDRDFRRFEGILVRDPFA